MNKGTEIEKVIAYLEKGGYSIMRDTVLVSIDYDDKTNKGVLCVGRQLPNKSVDIVNAIDGPEAKELFEKLITKKAVKK